MVNKGNRSNKWWIGLLPVLTLTKKIKSKSRRVQPTAQLESTDGRDRHSRLLGGLFLTRIFKTEDLINTPVLLSEVSLGNSRGSVNVPIGSGLDNGLCDRKDSGVRYVYLTGDRDHISLWLTEQLRNKTTVWLWVLIETFVVSPIPTGNVSSVFPVPPLYMSCHSHPFIEERESLSGTETTGRGLKGIHIDLILSEVTRTPRMEPRLDRVPGRDDHSRGFDHDTRDRLSWEGKTRSWVPGEPFRRRHLVSFVVGYSLLRSSRAQGH